MILHFLLAISFSSNLLLIGIVLSNIVFKNDIKEMLNQHKETTENDKT